MNDYFLNGLAPLFPWVIDLIPIAIMLIFIAMILQFVHTGWPLTVLLPLVGYEVVFTYKFFCHPWKGGRDWTIRKKRKTEDTE